MIADSGVALPMNASDIDPHREESIWVSPRLHKIVKRIVGNAADAEDVLHDTYERYLRYLAQPDRDTSESNSLLTMVEKLATQGAYDLLQKKKTTTSLRRDIAGALEDAMMRVGPDDYLNTGQENEQLVHHIKQLPAALRTVFVMHNVQEIPRKEIAEQLGISKRTVADHLRHSMRHLSHSPHTTWLHVSSSCSLPSYSRI